jgi:hypothetical protein
VGIFGGMFVSRRTSVVPFAQGWLDGKDMEAVILSVRITLISRRMSTVRLAVKRGQYSEDSLAVVGVLERDGGKYIYRWR